jgi:hypothetical protein
MRTKTLLLTAVLGVAGAASTTVQAQSVYSQNAVGYVNLSLNTGFTIIANPLNNTTNDADTILTNVPTGTVIYTYNNTSQLYQSSTFADGKWNGAPVADPVLTPGSAFFIKLTAATTVTFVGNVPQGTLANTIPVGFSLQSVPVPISASLSTNAVIALAGTQGDIAYAFVNSSSLYTSHTYVNGKFNPDYSPAVGEGFFYLSKATSAKTWSVTFSVN